MTNPKSSRYLYGIDAVRFISALMVAVFHLGFSVWANPESGAASILKGAYSLPQLTSISWFGWVGVEIFFVISGFVIANSAHGSSAWKFLQSRVLRLYPAAWCCASVTAIILVSLGVYGGTELAVRYAHSITLFPIHPWVDPVYWTLAVEIVFYGLIFAVIAANAYRHIFQFALGLSVWSGLYSALCFVEWAGLDVPYFSPLGLQASRLSLLQHGSFFALGILLWLWSEARLGVGGKILSALVSVICVLEIVVHVSYVAVETPKSPLELTQLWFVPVVVWAVSVAAVFLSAKCHEAVASLPKPILGGLRTAGLMTYPLYLVHFTLGVSVARGMVYLGMTPIGALIVAIGVGALISFVVSKYCEPAIRNALRPLLGFLERHSVASGWLSPIHRTSARLD